MSRGVVRRTERADEDLLDIWVNIALESERAADSVVSGILDRCDLLAEFPFLGQVREGLAARPRHSPVGNYLVIYEPISDPKGINVLRVLHGARDIEELFR